MMARLHGYFLMTKPRAMAVVLVTAAAGYLLAIRGSWDFAILVHLLLGAGLSGGGSIVLNQYLERDHDRHMLRTRLRPLPSGLISPRAALIYGIVLSVVGTAWLAVFVNGITSILGGLCVVSYVLLYTPLKRVTTLNTAVGAVPGAIPPMMGWTAVTGAIDLEAWVLFLILFIWQFPHFLAIGWLYRDDYARAGYTMLAGRDPDGRVTARQMVLNASCLMVVSLLPVSISMAGPHYGTGAVMLGIALLVLCLMFRVHRSTAMARLVLKGSVVHIALLMIFLVADKLR
ncbi:MAG: heme o synthase [Planctomycetes bacterium]|nr:heme o synthase [Planctomycetota bacterium]